MRDGEAAGTAKLAAAAFAVLLLATFGAFFLSSRLKAEPAELADLERMRYFSPNGDGRRDVQRIRFSIDVDDDDRAAVDIVDADGARVRRLADRLPIRPGRRARVHWDGRQDDGRSAPDGQYRMRLILRREGRAVLAGKAFTLDTAPPAPAALVSEANPVIVPGQPAAFRIRGAGTSAPPRFRILRTDVRPPRPVRTFTGEPGRRSHAWDGRDDDGAPVAPGTYLIAVTSRDRAGNEGTGPPLPPRRGRVEGRPGVTVRRLAVQPPVRPVRAGALAGFRVDARGRRYSWSVRRLGSGRAAVAGRRPKRGTTLLVRAPQGPSGVYLLEVRSRGATTRVPFAVQARGDSPPQRPLVVLPAMSWLGRSPLDDSPVRDGLPDTFSAGADVPFPRLFAFPGGLPPGFADETAPLLVWLDRQERRYDVTTDLALALDARLDSDERRGVLLAGAPGWVSRGLARRLRRFVGAGGRVAIFGTGALRAGVSVRDGRLIRPTPPGPADAFGARLGPVRTVTEPPGGGPATLSVLQEKAELGLLEGFGGVLAGFTRVEELASAGPRAALLTGVGLPLTEEEAAEAERENRTPRDERPAFSAVRSGEGLVIRVGLPEWTARLVDGDATVEQLTRNVLDLLAARRPRATTAG